MGGAGALHWAAVFFCSSARCNQHHTQRCAKPLFSLCGERRGFIPAAHSPGQNPRFCRSPRLRGSWPQGRFGQAAPVPCPAKKKTSLSGGFQKLSNSYFSSLPQLKACATTPPSTRYWWFAPSYTSGCSFSGSILPSSASTLSSTLTFTTSPTRRQVCSS